MTAEERNAQRDKYSTPMSIDIEVINNAINEGNYGAIFSKIIFVIIVVILMFIIALLSVPFFVVTCCCKKDQPGRW